MGLGELRLLRQPGPFRTPEHTPPVVAFTQTCKVAVACEPHLTFRGVSEATVPSDKRHK